MKRVVVAIISKDTPEGKKYLLLSSKRKFGKYTGLYYPPGGHLENNEDEKDALIREIKEELGIEVSPQRKIAETPGDIKNQITYWWMCGAKTERVRLQKDEIKDIAWFTKDEIKNSNKVWPATKKFFEEYLP